MFLRNYILLLGLGCILFSCKREAVLSPGALNAFTVTADSTTGGYFLGSKTTFNFTGNPFTITFFSGEQGRNYQYRNRTSAMGVSRFIFTATLNLGAQNSTLHVMVSSNFKGVALGDTTTTLANIAAATWADVTPTNMPLTGSVTDTLDLSSYATQGSPVYIAFKYMAKAGTLQNKWTITNVNLTNTLADGSVYTIANLNATTTAITNYGGVATYSPGWVAYTPSNTKRWTVNAGTSLIIDSTNAVSTVNSESWAFMGNIDLRKVTPDAGVAVKGISAAVAPFTYIYAATGTYNAAFLATNNSSFTTDSVVKYVPVVIK
ncbi:MAG: DUF5017 domain-containing protein [Niabella sp.]|nr:DUF5017 domain-containing protein [Niabella sp.]